MTLHQPLAGFRLGLFAALLLLTREARAQVDMGAGVGPDAFAAEEKEGARAHGALSPLGLALSLAFDATTWTTVQASTAPAQELTGLLHHGFYKLELLQLLLIAEKAKAPLKELLDKRHQGRRLRDLAKDRAVDFDAVYEESLVLDAKVVGEFLPSVMSVAVSTSAGPARREKSR